MKWIETKRYQAPVSVNGEMFNVLCEDDGGIALSINGDYVKDLDELPAQEELVGIIMEYAYIESLAEETAGVPELLKW